MKDTLSTNQIVDRLYSDDYAGWSYNGACALAEYLEELEDETGQEMEFDRVAIRCQYSEYEGAFEAAVEYGFEPDEEEDTDEQEESALRWLQDRMSVIVFDGGVIIQDF